MSKSKALSLLNYAGLCAGAMVAVAVLAGAPWPAGDLEAAVASETEPHEGHAHEDEDVATPNAQGVAQVPQTAPVDACCTVPQATMDKESAQEPGSTSSTSVKSEDKHAEEGHGHEHGEDSHDHAHGAGEMCPEHGVLELDCAICQPQRAVELQPGEGLKLRMPSAVSAELAGLVAVPGQSASSSAEGATALCRIDFDPKRIAHLTPLIEGVIRQVDVELGAAVEKGQPLVQIAAPALADAKDAYLTALADVALAENTLQREKSMREKGIATEQEYQNALAAKRKAETAEFTARQRLLDVGITEDQLKAIQSRRDTGTTITLRAPFSGTVIEWHAISGEAVGREESILTIADLSRMALNLSVPKALMASVRVGSGFEVRFEELPGIAIEGKIDWVSPSLNEGNRTLEARALVDNPGGLLRSGMFGTAIFKESVLRQGVRLPKEAVQRYDGKPFVFVQMAADLFDVRRVNLGREDGTEVEIVEGLSPEEPVVVAQSFAVKSEFLKSRLGAGCTHD
ncbi:MAG: hypothetical protein AMXMBFR84_17130 [Candidatus Hydrogenedentota bacterium]